VLVCLKAKKQAENIPSEPDPGNAGEGKKSLFSSIDLLVIKNF
jgi:hypothetical protein